ncbi:hypothetical protein QUA70_00940 [Microcoleus sp. LAD1_D5]|uniref:hypothetical protein n=1 Tax=unclassified Microcoleus TaxID=2642155 RepID=UPI002FD1CA45
MPVPQSSLFFVERASSPLLILVQDVSLNSDVAPFSRTGKMPVPQSSLFFVERASSPLLILVQNVNLNQYFVGTAFTNKI